MNGIDVVILILLLISTFNGLRQGLIRALANLIGWVLAFMLAKQFHQQLEPFMHMLSQDASVQSVLAFGCIIIVVMLMVWLCSALLQSVFRHLKLSWLNRLAGAGFGFAKCLVVFLIVLHIIHPWIAGSSLWKNSKMVEMLYPYAAITSKYSQEIVQITTDKMESHQSDEINQHQSDIIPNRSTDGKRQVDNPFL